MALAVTKYKKYFIKKIDFDSFWFEIQKLACHWYSQRFHRGSASLLAFKLCAIFDRAIFSRMYGSWKWGGGENGGIEDAYETVNSDLDT